MDGSLPVVEADRKVEELLAIIEELDFSIPFLVFELFKVLAECWAELGESNKSKDLMKVVCDRLAIDPLVFSIYRQCPLLVVIMERLRRGETVRSLKVKLALSEEARQWWHALLVIRVLQKSGGIISHVRLLRWLGHQADAQQIRTALALMREAGLVQTFQVKGSDPMRPITWHRLSVGPANIVPNKVALVPESILYRVICQFGGICGQQV